jgi:hypothetical protein
MIKSLVFKFFSAFSSSPTALREDERDALIEAQKNIKLKGSMQERLAATKEWSKLENIEARLKALEAEAVLAAERGKKFAEEVRKQLGEDPVIPDPLPEEFIGQQPSTIKAILKQRSLGDDRAFVPY